MSIVVEVVPKKPAIMVTVIDAEGFKDSWRHVYEKSQKVYRERDEDFVVHIINLLGTKPLQYVNVVDLLKMERRSRQESASGFEIIPLIVSNDDNVRAMIDKAVDEFQLDRVQHFKTVQAAYRFVDTF